MSRLTSEISVLLIYFKGRIYRGEVSWHFTIFIKKKKKKRKYFLFIFWKKTPNFLG